MAAWLSSGLRKAEALLQQAWEGATLCVSAHACTAHVR